MRRLALIVLALAAGCSSSDSEVLGVGPTMQLLALQESIAADGSEAAQLLVALLPGLDAVELGGREVVFSTTLGGLGGTDQTRWTTTTTPEGAAGIALRGTGAAGTARVTADVASLALARSVDVELVAPAPL